MKIKTFMAMMFAAFMFTACSSDDDGPEVDEKAEKEIVVSAEDYSVWNYVNLETGKITPVTAEGKWTFMKFEEGQKPEVVEEREPEKRIGEVPAKWHIAFHKYDARTNGGEVLLTQYKDLDEAVKAEFPEGSYIKDKKFEGKNAKIIVDMSGMMKGIIGYAGGYMNEELSKWVTKTPTHSMPPYKYEVPDAVFAVKFPDGSKALLEFDDYMDDNGKKCVEFEYIFFNKK